MDKTIFEKIISREIKTNIIYEDDFTLAFNDINPQAPIHILIIPKKKIVDVASASIEDIEIMGRVLYSAKLIAAQMQLTDGYRLVLNNGVNAGQTVPYLHCHLLGGRSLKWPPG